jgi:subfamily B ATP-binding cassette protein MsbA
MTIGRPATARRACATLLENTDVLVLDEATSDLDSNLENLVQQATEEMDRDYAIVTIVNRLSTVKNADRIYTMERAESQRLDSTTNSLGREKYAELYGIQVNW